MTTQRLSNKKTWLVDRYLNAKETVLQRGFAAEIDWQTTASIDLITEEDFLRESSWVILSAGMRETVVRKCFPGITRAFLNWAGSEPICRNRAACKDAAISVFAHPKKISSIIGVAAKVLSRGFEQIKSDIKIGGAEVLQEFDYIGPVTCYHLAKNLGLDVVKPDRHLVRLASATKSSSPHDLCSSLSDATGDRLAVVDLVLWRYATLEPEYAEAFTHPTSLRAA